MLHFVFHPDAEAEHLETVTYLESRRAGLGALYLSDFETTMVRVCKHPDRYRIEIKPDIRRVRLARFPYSVIYRSADNLVQILAVAHLRRRPQYWQQRL